MEGASAEAAVAEHLWRCGMVEESMDFVAQQHCRRTTPMAVAVAKSRAQLSESAGEVGGRTSGHPRQWWRWLPRAQSHRACRPAWEAERAARGVAIHTMPPGLAMAQHASWKAKEEEVVAGGGQRWQQTSTTGGLVVPIGME